MHSRSWTFLFFFPFLTACAEPLTKSQVVAKFADQTVSKISQNQATLQLGPNDPSLGERNIYHAPNGNAYYVKQTSKGYKRRDSGRWWAGENQICYAMNATNAEHHSGAQCSSANTEIAFSSFKKGDVLGLVPRQSAAGSQQGGGRERPNCVLGTEPGCSYSWLPTFLGGAAVVGTGLAVLCKGIDCTAGSPGGAASAQSDAGGPQSGSGSTSQRPVAAPSRGVNRIENWGSNPAGTSPQWKVTCQNGTTHRFWKTDGKWDGPFGWIGKDNLDRDQLASFKCS